MEELEEQIKVVAEAREELRAQKNRKKELFEKWEQDNKDLLYDIELKVKFLEDDEGLLRDMTVSEYNKTGSKAPAPGVGIREITKLDYDGKIAFDWAKAHEMALMLDTKAFEKIAKADPPDFVKITTRPQATIATDLGKALGEPSE